MTDEKLTQLAINTIRTLSIDAGPAGQVRPSGTPIALAPLIYTIWNRVMRFDPDDPFGLTATVSCYRMATALCYSGRYSKQRADRASEED